METFKISIQVRKLDDDTFREECERFEREQRKKNAWTAFFILLGIVVVQVILGVLFGVSPKWGPV